MEATGKRAPRRRVWVLGCFAVLPAVCPAFGLGAAWAQPEPKPTTRQSEPGPVAGEPSSAPATAPMEGFRQARFGMSEQQVRQAVQKDFPAAAARLARATHPREKTTVLTATVEDLLPDAGPARISYILGYASKRLVQVNVVWASDGRTAARDEAVVAAANALRDHFLQQFRAPDEIVANQRAGGDAILVFRAARADGRMVLLLLSGAAAAGRAGRDPPPPPLALQLSYMRDHANPDVFRIERGRF